LDAIAINQTSVWLKRITHFKPAMQSAWAVILFGCALTVVFTVWPVAAFMRSGSLVAIVTGAFTLVVLATELRRRQDVEAVLRRSNEQLEDFVAHRTEKLRESEEKFRLFVDHAPAAVAMFDRDMRYIAVSRRWMQDFQLTENIISRSHYEIFPDIPERWKEVHRRGLAGAVQKSDGDRFDRADGSVYWSKWEVRPWFDSSGNIGGIVIFVEDATARTRAEQVLSEAEARFRATFEQAAIGMAQVTLEGKFLLVNQRFCDITGYAQAELLGRTFQEITHPDDLEANLTFLRRTLRGEAMHYSMEKRYIRKNGSVVWVELTVAPVLDAGKPKYFISAIEDITGRKLAEESLAEYSRQQQVLFKLVDELHRAVSLDNVYDAALDAIISALRCGRASILLFDEAGAMRFVAWRGLSSAHRKIIEGRCPWTPGDKNPQPILISDINAAEMEAPQKAAVEAEGIRALAFIPLVCNGRLIGKFMAYFDEPYTLSSGEIGLSLTIGRQLAFGIDRKRADNSLRQNARQLTLITETAPVLIAHCDTQSRIKFANKAYGDKFGLKPEDCIGRTVAEVVGEDAYRTLLPYLETTFRGTPVEFETELVYSTIGTHFVHCSYAPEFDANGKVIGLVAAITDITERKRIEEALGYQLDLTRTITHNTQSCLWMMDAEGRGTFVNPASERISGFKPEELIGHVLHNKVHHTRPDGTRFPIEECPLETALPLEHSVVGYEDTFIHKDGHFYPVRCSGRPIFEGGRAVGTVIEVQDITEEKRLLQAEREARQQAEVSNRLKDEFLATLSHELRTPLNAILGWVVMLRSGRMAPAKAVEALETVERNARAQNRLMEDLLDVSRIITGKLELKFQPVVLARVVEAAVASLRPAAEAKGMHLSVAYDSRACQLYGDADRLQQVVWNLVSNAIKFTPMGGSVEARVQCCSSYVEIKVSDTGEGIEPGFVPYVFDRFRQADSSIHRKHSGLGLGLAIVRHLVELHGGEVSVESAGLGQGATFTVKLPLTTTQNANLGVPNKVPAAAIRGPQFAFRGSTVHLSGLKVLVVDDEADARSLLAAMLTVSGADTRAAGSMSEALSVLDEWRPDVLVCDIGMPEGSGYDLIREIRNHTGTSKFPAVALSAYARPEDRLRALSAGFEVHVPKPVEPDQLLATIASLAKTSDLSKSDTEHSFSDASSPQ
jgi:PAS domain S-box-containing protein